MAIRSPLTSCSLSVWSRRPGSHPGIARGTPRAPGGPKVGRHGARAHVEQCLGRRRLFSLRGGGPVNLVAEALSRPDQTPAQPPGLERRPTRLDPWITWSRGLPVSTPGSSRDVARAVPGRFVARMPRRCDDEVGAWVPNRTPRKSACMPRETRSCHTVQLEAVLSQAHCRRPFADGRDTARPWNC